MNEYPPYYDSRPTQPNHRHLQPNCQRLCKKSEQYLDYEELNKFLSMLKPGDKILDAGCGSGRDSAFFISKGFPATSIDLSENLLKQAIQLHPELTTQVMDMRKLSFDDDTFGGIWSHASILHLRKQDAKKAIKEFYRVTKPSGTCFVQVKQGKGEAWASEKRSSGKNRFYSYYQQDELESLVKQAGFGIRESYLYNELTRGVDRRNVNWIVIYAQKPTS